jgi:hypothetical protein
MTAGITRTLLGLGDLNLNTDPFIVVDVKPGEVQWRRQETASFYVDGEFTVGRAKNSPRVQWTQQVSGTDQDDLDANMAALIDAFEQDTFQISYDLDGNTHTWRGECADWNPTYEKERVHGLIQLVVFSFKRMPRALAGAI